MSPLRDIVDAVKIGQCSFHRDHRHLLEVMPRSVARFARIAHFPQAPLQTCSLRHRQTPRRKDASRNECLKVYQKLLSTPCDCVLSPASAMPTRRCHRSAGRRRAGQGKKAANGSEKPVDKANLRLLLPFACEHLQQIDEIYSRFVQHPECARTRLSRKNIPLLVIAATNYRFLRSKARSNASKPPARTSNNRLVLFDMKTCAT